MLRSISVSGDRTLRVWSAETGDCLLIIDAHTRGIASLDIDVGTGTCVTGSSDWGIRRHELGEWGLDIGQGVGDDAEEREEGLVSWSSESSLGYPTIRRKRTAVRSSASNTAIQTADSTITSSSPPAAKVNNLEISPRQVNHPHGFEFRAGKGCCVSTTRPRFLSSHQPTLARTAAIWAPPRVRQRPAVGMLVSIARKRDIQIW
jgi:hypothetical protein